MVTLAHDGAAAYRDRFELIYRHRAAQPNAMWQADHTQLDLTILDASGKIVRPWLTTVFDNHSRALAGYFVFLGAPSALQTSLCPARGDLAQSRPDMAGLWDSRCPLSITAVISPVITLTRLPSICGSRWCIPPSPGRKVAARWSVFSVP